MDYSKIARYQIEEDYYKLNWENGKLKRELEAVQKENKILKEVKDGLANVGASFVVNGNDNKASELIEGDMLYYDGHEWRFVRYKERISGEWRKDIEELLFEDAQGLCSAYFLV
jgi:hypothetical protein